MNASELFQTGQLQVAIDAQIQKVQTNPTDQGARFFLFELMLFTGDIDRARKQIDVIKYDDPKSQCAVELYKFTLDAEQKRRRVLAGQEEPNSLRAAPEHMHQRLEAAKRFAAGHVADGNALLAQANEGLPNVKASINGQRVEQLRDGDDFFGTVLEVFGAGGLYCWAPLEQIETLTMKPPRFPRDVLLVAATLTIKDGPSGDVLLPAIYPGTHAGADDLLRLGRATDWLGEEGQPLRGIGGRLFMSGDGGSWPLLNWREVLVS